MTIEKIDTAQTLTTDVAIVGSGIAGLVTATELEALGLKCVVIESGASPTPDQKWDLSAPDAKAADYGQKASYIDLHVQRTFGGGSNVWGGWCASLRNENFARPDLPGYASWPFPRTDLERHYAKAADVLEIAGGPSRIIDSARTLRTTDQAVIKGFGLSPPLRAAFAWGDRLRASQTIQVIPGATAETMSATGGRINEVVCRSISGAQIRVQARHIVLAGGACLNALLLKKNEQALGLAPEQGAVLGRYLFEHAYLYGRGKVILRPDIAEELEQSPHWFGGFLSVAPSQAALVAASARDFHALLLPIEEKLWTEPEKIAAQNFKAVHSKNAKLFSVIIGMEQASLVENHVSLKPSADGSLAGTVNLSFGPEQIELGRKAVAWLTRTAAHTWFDVGTDSDVVAVGHLMGTTRMASPGHTGVVDANCRVIGTRNLYVAGSSVFPSCGFVNPTLTIAALSIRLGQHLREVFNAP